MLILRYLASWVIMEKSIGLVKQYNQLLIGAHRGSRKVTAYLRLCTCTSLLSLIWPGLHHNAYFQRTRCCVRTHTHALRSIDPLVSPMTQSDSYARLHAESDVRILGVCSNSLSSNFFINRYCLGRS